MPRDPTIRELLARIDERTLGMARDIDDIKQNYVTHAVATHHAEQIASLQRSRRWLITTVIGSLFAIATAYVSGILLEARRATGL